MDFLELIGGNKELFESDISNHSSKLKSVVSSSSFLILGGAGSIGLSVTKEIFKEIQKNYR